MGVLPIGTALEQLFIYVLAASLALARMMAMISVMPAFTRLGVTGMLQASIALALSLPLLPLIASAVDAANMTTAVIIFLLLKEAVIGTVLGVVLGIPIWAAEAAGDILDLQRGSTFAGLMDPSAAAETSVTGTLFAVTIIALFFAVGGLPLMLRTVYDSYSLWPAQSFAPIFTKEAGRIFLGLLDDIMTMGLMLAVPVVLAMLLADLALALVARAAPHMHIFDLSLSVKNLLFAGFLVLYGAFLVSYMEYDLRWLLGVKDKLEGIGRAPTP
jgi:type III secretion protein T